MRRQQTTARESRILLVDDDPGTIRVLAEILKGTGKVHFTTRGTDALSLARSVAPDLILLDLEMPDRHGFVVCEEIKSDPVLSDVPVLFVTAHTDFESEARALEAGALDFIHKPPHPQVVKARVSNYLALKHQTDLLRTLSLIDGLTGIANRRAFDEAVHNEWWRACRHEYPLSLLIFDIDYFKHYNDTYGHQAGDDCLRAVAGCLAAKPRRPGDIVARYGGEEFVMLLPGCPLEHAVTLGETVRAAISELGSAHANANIAERVTVSVGVAASQTLCEHAEICWRNLGRYHGNVTCGLVPANLIGLADKALYQAKEGGRNRVETIDIGTGSSVAR